MKIKATIIIATLLALTACGTQTSAGSAGATATAVSSFSVPPPVTAAPPEITKAEFDQLVDGMTEEQVQGIVGAPGKVMSEYVGPKGYESTSSKTISYEAGPFGMCMLTYMGGKLNNRMQSGLK